MLIFTFLIISCEKTSQYPVKVETIDGIKVVTNPDFPRDEKIYYKLEEELSIGVEDGDDNYIFEWPNEIRVSEDGKIYVLDAGRQIKVYDIDGMFLRSIGRKGQGPGEFSGPTRFTISSDGRIITLDRSNARVTIFDTEGLFIRDFKALYAVTNWYYIYSDKKNNIYFSKEYTDQDQVTMSIHCYDLKGNEFFNYGKFKAEKILMRKDGERLQPYRTSMSPTTVWGVNEDGLLYAGYNENYEIIVHDKDGKSFLKFGRKFTPIPDEKNWLSGYYDNLPAYSREIWLFDEKGNIWISLFDITKPITYIYDVFNPKGIYIKQVILEHQIYDMKKGKIYSVLRNEDGVPMIKRFRFVEIAE